MVRRRTTKTLSPLTAGDRILREQLAALLEGSEAHADAPPILRAFPAALRGLKPHGAPHSAWQLLEHMRIAQWDILEYCRNPDHKSPKWSEGYWPATEAPPSPHAWDRSCKEFLSDRSAMKRLVARPGADLFAKIPHGGGQTLLREALLVVDHNAYHLGQLVLVRRMLGVWPADDKSSSS